MDIKISVSHCVGGHHKPFYIVRREEAAEKEQRRGRAVTGESGVMICGSTRAEGNPGRDRVTASYLTTNQTVQGKVLQFVDLPYTFGGWWKRCACKIISNKRINSSKSHLFLTRSVICAYYSQVGGGRVTSHSHENIFDSYTPRY
jgi:hypothetical protein